MHSAGEEDGLKWKESRGEDVFIVLGLGKRKTFKRPSNIEEQYNPHNGIIQVGGLSLLFMVGSNSDMKRLYLRRLWDTKVQ